MFFCRGAVEHLSIIWTPSSLVEELSQMRVVDGVYWRIDVLSEMPYRRRLGHLGRGVGMTVNFVCPPHDASAVHNTG